MSQLSTSVKSSDEILESLSATCRDLLGSLAGLLVEDTHPSISECAHSLATSFLGANEDQRLAWKLSLVEGTEEFRSLEQDLKDLQKRVRGNRQLDAATTQAGAFTRAVRHEMRSAQAQKAEERRALAETYDQYTNHAYLTSQAAGVDLFRLTSEAVEELPRGALSLDHTRITALFSFVKPEGEAWEILKSSMATGFPCIDNTATSIRERLAAAKNAQDLEGADVHPCVSAAISVAEKFERLWRAEH